MLRVIDAVQWQADHFEEIPVLVVPCLRGNHIPFMPVPPMAQSSYYGSIYPSVQNLLLAARAMLAARCAESIVPQPGPTRAGTGRRRS